MVGLAFALLAAGIAATVVFMGGDDSATVVNAHRAAVGEPALIAVPGYAYGDVAPDSEVRRSMETAVSDLQASVPEGGGLQAPRDVILEQDFSLGAGQFGEWADDTSSASVVDGRYRMTALDPGWYAWTYSEFAPKDSVGISARVQSVGALSAGAGPGLVIQRSDQDGYVLDISTEYGATISRFTEAEEVIELASRSLPAAYSGAGTLSLVVSSTPQGTQITGSIDEIEAVAVLDNGSSGGFTAAGLVVSPDVASLAIDFDDVVVRAGGGGSAAPAITGWSLHRVMAGSTEVGAFGLMAMSGAVTSDTGFDNEQMVALLAGGMAGEGATAEVQTLAGERVAIGETGDGSVLAWMHDDVISFAMGDDLPALRRFAEAYLQEVHT